MRRPMDPLSARSFPLWFGVLAPPLAWGAHLLLGDLIFELGCAPGVRGHTLVGLSLETVKTRIHRGRLMIRRKLEAYLKI